MSCQWLVAAASAWSKNNSVLRRRCRHSTPSLACRRGSRLPIAMPFCLGTASRRDAGEDYRHFSPSQQPLFLSQLGVVVSDLLHDVDLELGLVRSHAGAGVNALAHPHFAQRLAVFLFGCERHIHLTTVVSRIATTAPGIS